MGNSVAQRWKFGGKELDESLDLDTYDFGARNYDPALGRWMNIDPLADNYYAFSGYNYTLNNPVLFLDPDGMKVEFSEDLKKKENRKQRREIKKSIRQFKRESKTFRKLFRELDKSKSVFTISEGQLGGADGTFLPAEKMIDDLDENGEPKGFDEFGIATQKENPNTGGDIIFDLSRISENGLNINDVLPEEFAHAFQFLTHTEGGSFENYGLIPPKGNFEFEGQMISGIVKNQAGARLHPIYGSTRAAERAGINYNPDSFGMKIEDWYNRADNFYRTHAKVSIDNQKNPTALEKLLEN